MDELQIGDQAYKQVYASVTGHDPDLKWFSELEQKVSKNQKCGAWFQLALLLLQVVTPYVAKALNVDPTLSRVGEPSLAEVYIASKAQR